MSVLCSRSSARVEGDVLFNGRPMTKTVKRSLGFVTQDDLLFAEVRHVYMRAFA
jgi:ABC-type multidrug transport system ATPase subunit